MTRQLQPDPFHTVKNAMNNAWISQFSHTSVFITTLKKSQFCNRRDQMPTEIIRTVTSSSEIFARDAMIAWFRGEFAAANAIIDALCSHLAQISGGSGDEYVEVFNAIDRRRVNWIDILQMQKYHPISEVVIELQKVAERKMVKNESEVCEVIELEKSGQTVDDVVENEALVEYEDSPDSDITDGGSQGTHSTVESTEICSSHEDCDSRPNQIKLTKGFVAMEPVKGHMVNVVKGLKLYEDIFTESELSKLCEFVHELQISGRNGELPGETFKIFNQKIKGNKRELIQFGEPIFRQIKEDGLTKEQNNIEQIPPLLQNVIEHLAQWRLIPLRMPNSCIINFFDEGEHSQPYLKPPHLDQPVTTLVLSDTTMAFGCTIVSENGGNYTAPLMLPLKKGSLLVMRANSADIAAHAMCSSPTKRVAITFFRVRSDINHNSSPTRNPTDRAMTMWQPGTTSPHPSPASQGYCAPNQMMPNCGVLYAAVPIMLPPHSMALDIRRGGTGVFLPWNESSKKHTKHLPPRAQKVRRMALRSAADETPKTEATANTVTGTPADGKAT